MPQKTELFVLINNRTKDGKRESTIPIGKVLSFKSLTKNGMYKFLTTVEGTIVLYTCWKKDVVRLLPKMAIPQR